MTIAIDVEDEAWNSEPGLEPAVQRAAREVLRNFGASDNRDPRFYKLLAEAEERLKDDVNSHYDLAEYYRAVGETELAAEQLKLAQTIGGISHYQRMRVDARLAEIEMQTKALKQNLEALK